MAYSTRADLVRRVGGEDRLIQLADLDSDGIEDAGVVDSAIAEVEGIINSYVKKRNGVPVAASSPELVAVSASMAVRRLRAWKGMPWSNDAEEERIDIDWLKDLATGKAVLTATSPAASELVIDKAEPRESTKSVSRDKLKGFW